MGYPTSSSATTTLTNTGTQSLMIFTLDLTGLKQNNFEFTSNCLGILAVGHSCTGTLTGSAPHTGFFGQLEWRAITPAWAFTRLRSKVNENEARSASES